MPKSRNRSGNRGGRNNNPEGRNQYSDWGVMEMARERPFAAAAAAAGAAAAGLFLWSKRTQITDQLAHLSDQIGEWRGSSGSEFGSADEMTSTGSTTARNRGMSETGGGNASLGGHSGGGGTTGSASGRRRAGSTSTT